MFRLFTTWYPCLDEHRQSELATAFCKNLTCPAVDQFCILREADAILPAEDPRIVIREINRRPLFEDFFAWIRKMQGDDDIAVIANTDIWLDASAGLADAYLPRDHCWALARWDCWTKKLELFDRNDSQDAWFFRGPLKQIRGDFPLGGIRCDNRLLYEIQQAGYLTRNPAFSVICHHQHDEPPRDYAEENHAHYVEGPYRYLWPHNLLGCRETRRHNATSSIPISWRIDPREVQKSLPARAWQFMRRGFKRSAPST